MKKFSPLIICLFGLNILLNAQIVHSSHYDEIAAQKKGTLSTSKSSGSGAEPVCKLTNISDVKPLCIGDSITLSLNYNVTNFDTIHLKWFSFDSTVLSDTTFYDFNLGPGNSQIVVKKPGTYYMDLYSINNSTGTSDCYYAWVIQSTLPVTIPENTIFCPGGSVQLTAPAGKFSTYQWYKNNTLLSGKKQKTYIADATGNYYVRIKDSNNCTLNSDKINVTVYNPPATLNITGDPCAPTFLKLSVNQGDMNPDTIKWYRNDVLIKTLVNEGTVVAGGNGKGSGPKQLNAPYGLFLDSSKNIYVADYNNYRVMKYAPGSTAGVMVGGSLNYFGNPTDVAKYGDTFFVSTTRSLAMFSSTADTNGENLGGYNLWGISLAGNNPHVTTDPIYNGTGGQALVFYINGSGNYDYFSDAGDAYPGTGLTHLNYPNGIYIDSLSNLFIADNYIDSLNNNVGRILKWHILRPEGKLIAGGTTYGNAPNKISFAAGITFDKKGNMYVSDPVNKRVQLWKPGADHGVTLISGFKPWGIKVDDDYKIYVVDQTNNRVLKFPSLFYNKLTVNEPGVYKAVVTYPGGCVVTSGLYTVTSCAGFAGNDALISADKSKWVLNVTPNPVQTKLTVHIKNIYGATSISVVDITGKTLATQQIQASGNNDLIFNTGILSSGIYFIQVMHNGEKMHLRFVKQ